ncbi:MAG: hypothetical protein ABI334_00870 [Candidatus Dormiibacterota bacterium]
MTSHTRVVWAFWIACALAAVGALVPLLVSGTSSRIDGAVVPFAVAAIALGACGVLYQQGRAIATTLYFIAGLAIVYGILTMLALPLRLAVLGTCPPEPALCTSGLERPITDGETNGLGLTAGLGIVAVLIGFFGLTTLYRRASAISAPAASTPPVRRIAPVGSKPAAEAALVPEPAPEPTPAPAAEPAPEPTPGASEPEPEQPLELAAPVEELELPAHVEPLELAAPEAAPPAAEAPPAVRAPRKPRRPRTPPSPEPPPDTP